MQATASTTIASRDHTLPGEVTDYVVTVHFDVEGNIGDVATES